MEDSTKKFIGGLVVGLVIGSLVGVSIYASVVLNHLTALTGMTWDIREITSEIRDSNNCMAYGYQDCVTTDKE